MNHADHVNLVRRGVEGAGSAWADFGAGSGAFTLALADLLGPNGQIHAVDRDAGALRTNAKAMGARFPPAHVQYVQADFAGSLPLPPLDGIVMANSLHFQREQPETIHRIRTYLKPGGRLVVVEYNIDRANFAVPHPVSYSRWETLAHDAGFARTELLMRRPSRTFAEIYSAMSL